jgi:subfamily B ATP-binding cassette protein MsbA
MGLSGWQGPLAKLLYKYAWSLPVVVILGLVGSLLEGIGIGLLMPLVALLSADTMPAGIPTPILALAAATTGFERQSRIVLLGLAVMGFIAIKGAMQAANQAFMASLEGRLGRDIRNAVGARILALDYGFFLRHEKARLVQIIYHDCWNTSQSMRYMLATVPAAVALFVFALILLYLDWRLAVIAIAGAALVQGLLVAVQKRQRRLSE